MFMDINRLSARVGVEWYVLGIELGFQTPQLEQLRYAYPHAIQQCVSAMLTEWYNVVTQEIPDPSALLSEAFKNVERGDVSFEINQDLHVTDIEFDKEKIQKVNQLLMAVSFNRKSNNFENFYLPSKCCIENFEKEKHNYVETNAMKAAIEKLKTTKHITVVGNAGDGKTTLVMSLLSKINKEAYYPVILSDPSLIEQAFDPDRKVVYFVDDAFGTPTINRILIEAWLRLHGKLNAFIVSGNCHLILATRKQTYQKSYTFIRDCPCYVGNLIDLTSKQYELTSSEKKKIIACYSSLARSRRRTSHRIVPPMVYIPGFPLLCSLYAKHESTGNISEFFEKPIAFLQRQLNALEETEPDAYCALVLVMLYDGKLPVDIFNPFEMKDKDKQKIKTITKACGVDKSKSFADIEKSLKSLIGVYLENNNGYFEFSHDSVFDAMCLEFGRKYPKQVIEVATSDFITSRVRADNLYFVPMNDIPEVILINASHYQCLVERWMKDIKKGKMRNVFDNPCSKNESIIKFIVDHISKLSDSDFEILFEVQDKEMSTTLFEMICRRGVTTIVREILKCPAFEKYTKPGMLFLSLIEAVQWGHDKVVQEILNYQSDIHYGCLKNGRQAIHLTAENGNTKMMKILIDGGANVSAKDIYRVQPVHLASSNQSSACLALLLKNGASHSADDNSNFEPIHYACQNGSIECVKLLIDKGASVNSKNAHGKSPIHYAASCDRPDILKYLLSQNPDLKSLDANRHSALHSGVISGKAENIRSLILAGCDPNLKDAFGRSPLHIACSSSLKDLTEEKQCMEALIDNGANVNICDQKGKTPLHYACSWSCDHRYNCVALLLENGADPNATDSKDKQPIEYAFKSKSSKCANLLMEKGSDVNNEDLNPVHNACASGIYEMLLTLYEKGFSMTEQDANGKQPVHYASQYGNLQCLRFLIENGVDLNAKDEKGQTPLHYSCKWGKSKCRDLLVDKGADITIKDSANRTPTDLLPAWSPFKKALKQSYTKK